MDHQHIIRELERNGTTFYHLLKGVEADNYRWRPAENKWNLLEIVCHLHDEEREDFRTRLRHALETPAQHMPPIYPENWVKERSYESQDYEGMLNLFVKERKQSVQWLRGLQNPDWNSAYVHPKMGPLRAELFLANWLAHDLLHIRQVTRLQYRYLQEKAGISLAYAGEW